MLIQYICMNGRNGKIKTIVRFYKSFFILIYQAFDLIFFGGKFKIMIGNAKYDLYFDENYCPNRYHLLELNDTLYKAVEANESYFTNKNYLII